MGHARRWSASIRREIALPQLPQDLASGAARSMLAIAEILAAAGFDIRCLATTATEGRTGPDFPVRSGCFTNGVFRFD